MIPSDIRPYSVGNKWVAPVEGDGDEEVGDDEVGEAAGEESRKVKKMMDPLLPSEDEVREHQLTHLPFRNWCHHCVRGRGKEMNHTKRDRDDED